MTQPGGKQHGPINNTNIDNANSKQLQNKLAFADMKSAHRLVTNLKDWTIPTRCTLPRPIPTFHQQGKDDDDDDDDDDDEFDTDFVDLGDDDNVFLPFARAPSEPAIRSSITRVHCLHKMVKSNKFDYSNRNSAGTKLGNSIGQALEKEAAKLQKSADKLRKTSSSSSTTGTNEDSASKDAHAHTVDLKAPDKALTDDGLFAMADGLEIALKSGNHLALEDLNLSGNGLTTAALARLAPIMKLARHDFKTLDLSNNAIKVENDVEAAQWQTFLQSFAECFRLRRLDLTNNPELGDRALEILARVHTREDSIDPLPIAGYASVVSLPLANDSDFATVGDAHIDSYFTNHGITRGQVLRCRRGLRSIPYITLNNIGLTDAGALWLSYIVQDHYYPTQLIDGLNATRAATAISAYQQNNSIAGLAWDNPPPAGLGKDGRALLKKTEAFRYRTKIEEQGGADSPLAESGFLELVDDNIDGTDDSRPPKERGQSRGVPGDRRASIRSIRTNDGGEHETTELESIRRKIQRHMINPRTYDVELWRAALTLIHCSRILLYLTPQTRTLSTDEGTFHFPAKITPQPSPELTVPSPPRSEKRAETTKPTKKLTVDIARASRHRPMSSSGGSYAAKLTAMPNGNITSGDSDTAITDVTNTPTTPRMIFKPHRKGAFSEGTDTDFPALTEKLNGLMMIRNDSPERFVRYQKERLNAASECGHLFRDESVGCQLPRYLIEKTEGFVLSAEQMKVVSEEQKDAVWAWGQEKAGLRQEMEWRKHEWSTQVWMLLQEVGCLAYDGQ